MFAMYSRYYPAGWRSKRIVGILASLGYAPAPNRYSAGAFASRGSTAPYLP